MSNYIIQKMQQFSNVDYLFKDSTELYFLREHEKKVIEIRFDDLINSDNKLYMVVAEPGYGKTRLLKEITLEAQKKAYFVDAKKIKNNTIEEILKKCKTLDTESITEEGLQKQKYFTSNSSEFSLDENTIVCIDALDEVSVRNLGELFEKIEDLADKYKNVKLILSCRTHHIKKMEYKIENFDFEFITLEPFNESQIQTFIENKLGKKINLEEIYNKSKVYDLLNFIATPRYLYYFAELLGEGSTEEIIKLSRSKMFEHFIYRKLDKELREKIPQSQIDILKRVLEKLALIMKINQVSEITKDELMSIFDQMDSTFSQIIFRDDLISQLYDRSLIKDNIDTVEFENQEFLDYLSAKELVRLEKVEQAFFDIAVEPYLKELYTSWFYVLPFLLELKPAMIEIFLDFIDSNSHRAINMEYFQAITSMEPDNMHPELKSRVFDTVFDYFTEHNKWFITFNTMGKITRALARYYDPMKYVKIVNSIDGRKGPKDTLHVRRVNAVELIEVLVEHEKLDAAQVEYWKNKVVKWLKLDVSKNQYLHEVIVGSLATFSQGDIEWIKKLYFIFENGVEVQSSYADQCFKVAPNETFSIDVYLDADELHRKNRVRDNLRIEREYKYILQLDSSEAIIYALGKSFKDEKKAFGLCKEIESYAGDKLLDKFQKNLYSAYDEKLSMLLKQLIVDSLQRTHRHDCHKLYNIIIDVLIEKDLLYLAQLIKDIYTAYSREKSSWILHYTGYDYMFKLVNEDNFDMFTQTLEIFKDEKIRILEALYFREFCSDEIKKRIKKLYPTEIQKLEESSQARQEKWLKESKSFCEEWAEKIEPEPKKFSTDLFRYYNGNKSLKECPEHANNLKEMVAIAKEVLKNYNPLLGRVEKSERSATVYGSDYFRDCIEFVYNEKIKLTQEMIDNVFRYFPFDINSDHKITLAVAKNPSDEAAQDIVDVYVGKREDDLGIYHIRGFVDMYKKMYIKEAEDILLGMLSDDRIEEYEREYIIESLPSSVLTVEIIRENMKSLDVEDSLYQWYLLELIKKHHDEDAIEEAYKWSMERAKQLVEDDYFENSLDKTANRVSAAMAQTDYSIEKDKELLLYASELSGTGKKAGSNFITNIVGSHLKFLVEKKPKHSYKLISDMEKFIAQNADKKGLHWFGYKLEELKKIYLDQVQEKNIVTSVRMYNKLQKEDYLTISRPEHLLEAIKNIIEQDIRRWIEDEGAYKHIQELAKKDTNTNAEDFIQKSIKSQIELALHKKGLRETDIKREEQLLDDKRLDFTVSYGFIGSVMIELKLSHNSEAIASTSAGEKYVEKIKSYMDGSKSHFGLFVIFNVKDDKEKFNEKLAKLNELYKDEKEITVIGLNCR